MRKFRNSCDSKKKFLKKKIEKKKTKKIYSQTETIS